MEYLIQDEENFTRRKYSNETMRKIRNYIDKNNLKSSTEGYNEVLGRLDILISSKRLRTEEELVVDRLVNKEKI